MHHDIKGLGVMMHALHAARLHLAMTLAGERTAFLPEPHGRSSDRGEVVIGYGEPEKVVLDPDLK